MKKVTGNCDLCNKQFTAIHGLGLKKAIAWHKSTSHGIPGKYSDQLPKSQEERERALVRYYQKSGSVPKSKKAIDAFKNTGTPLFGSGTSVATVSSRKLPPEELQRRKNERQREYRAKLRHNGQTPELPQTHPALHDRCPNCGARFYYTL